MKSSSFGFIWRVKDLLLLDFPGGALDKNLPANAGDTGGFDLWSRIPHATKQLGLCVTTTEPGP